MKNHKRKKKQKPQTQKNVEGKKPSKELVETEEDKTKRCVLESLVDAFSLSSMKGASAAYDIACGDADKASEILRKGGLVEKSEDSFSSFSSYSSYSCGSGGGSSSSSSSSGLELGSKEREENCGVEGDVGCFKGGRQKKKVVAFASTGTVSTVLGKGYVRRNSTRNNKGFNGNGGGFDREEAEQFLCSMLGDDCDLNLGVVRDVLCQCGYDIEKASNVLLDLAGSTIEKSNADGHPDYRVDNIDDERFLFDPNDSLIDRRSESTSLSSDGDISDSIWSSESFGRKYAEVLSSSKANSASSQVYTEPGIPQRVSDIPQKLLESLFNIPKNTEQDKDTMNWKNVVKKLQSLGPGFNVSPHVAEPQQRTYAQGDEYYVFREDSNQYWDSVKSYYKKAATAYTKGDGAYAAYLSDQGREKTKLARKADTKASHDIFVARNKDIENVITIDLHGQHVKEAMRILKLHLLFGSYVPSVQTLRVITGCGSHGVGKSKLKQSVINLLESEAIEWREENRGTVLIKLNGCREYNFVDSNSDNDSND